MQVALSSSIQQMQESVRRLPRNSRLEHLERFQGSLPEGQGQNMALTVLDVPEGQDQNLALTVLDVPSLPDGCLMCRVFSMTVLSMPMTEFSR